MAAISSTLLTFARPGDRIACVEHVYPDAYRLMERLLRPLGIDVTLLNPGPYNTGFNDRMAESMWEWFEDDAVSAPATDMFRAIGQMVTSDQMDPAEVVERMVELVEADETTENNFVPAGIVDALQAQLAEE